MGCIRSPKKQNQKKKRPQVIETSGWHVAYGPKKNKKQQKIPQVIESSGWHIAYDPWRKKKEKEEWK